MSVSVVGFLAWGIIALLFVMSDRTVIFNTTKRQVEVFRHRFGTTPIAAYPASQFQSVRLSKVRIRAILLTRAELMTKDAPLRLIDHSNEATVRAVAAVATQALRVPLIDVTKDAK